jgi:hypothetical protein
MFKLVGFAVPRSGYGFTGAGASVQINDAITGAAATLYDEDEVATKANPLTADSTGMYEAKVLDGVYNIVITYNGGGTVTMNNIVCRDANYKNMLQGSSGTASKGDVVYQSGTDGTFLRPAVTAMTVDTIRDIGIVMSTSIGSGVRGKVCFTRGLRLAGVGSSWTPGGAVYVDASGTKTQTKPTGLCCILGYAASATDLVFDPQDPSIPATSLAEMSLDKNVIINSTFDVWQRTNADTASIANLAYHADRWQYQKNGAVVHTSKRSATVPTAAESGVTQRYSWNLLCTTGNASPAAGEYSLASQPIEGNRFRLIYTTKPCVLTFWVRATKTGNLPVAIRTASWTCVRRVTINAANTWEKKTVTFPVATGVAGMTLDETKSVELVFALHAGSTYQTSISNDGVWVNSTAVAFTTGDTNFAAATNDELYITSVQLEPGSEATQYQLRPFEEELRLCRRYYWKSMPYATAAAQNSGVQNGAITYRPAIAGISAANSQHVRFPTQMRAAPTITTFNPNAANANWRNFTDAGDSGAASVVGSTSQDGFTLANAQVATDALGEVIGIHASAESEL